jgi:argininosuccinate lyase
VADAHQTDIMPGYTHLQRAQPIVFAHHLLAYAEMFRRDLTRIEDAKARMNVSPLGACALAGTTYPISRSMTSKALGFDGYATNSIDAVSDRDFCVELLSCFSIIMMHLSRFSEEVILWTSWEFAYVELDDAYTTGSSIMPQKKNSDMAELVRGKTGRVYGDLMGTLTMLKGLPLAYNKDMQEDKESLFDATETVSRCLEIFAPMIRTMKVKSENMYRATAWLHQRHGSGGLPHQAGNALPYRLQDRWLHRFRLHFCRQGFGGSSLGNLQSLFRAV